MHRLPFPSNDHGIALLAALFMILALSLLGMTALHLATQELEGVAALHMDSAAVHVAEAGADRVVGWIHDPGAVPSEQIRTLLAKRMVSSSSSPSYFDAQGISQFRGTAQSPDILLDAGQPTHDSWLNDPAGSSQIPAQGTPKIDSLKVYAPTRTDLLCTVDVTAKDSTRPRDQGRTVRMQLAAIEVPSIGAAVEVGRLAASGAAAPSVKVHWGHVRVLGDAVLRNWQDVPSKTSLAPLTGQSYSEAVRGEDRWHEWRVGGAITLLQPMAVDSEAPLNVAQRLAPVPGVRFDTWDYAALKRIAQDHGTYYVVDQAGKLYLGGLAEGRTGLTLDEVMTSRHVGDRHGLVFIDTLDQQAPRADNLAHLMAQTSYAEGLYVINAHVTWRPHSTGQAFPALTPPTDGATSLATRVPVQLSEIHLNGVLYTPGSLTVENGLRVFGAVLAQETIVTSGRGLEVWYDHDFSLGLFRGLPVVTVAPGTWRTL